MENSDWTIRDKPFDLRERLVLFACVIVRLTQFLHTRGPVAVALSYQVLKSGTSAGANYEDADDGSSPRDALAKRRIVLRELKETRWRLRVASQEPWELGVGNWELTRTSRCIGNASSR
jgi:four helix bundle protein